MTEPHDARPELDPTLVRNQRALTTSEGTAWIAAAAVASVLVGGMMLVLWWGLESMLALVGALTTALLLLAMIVVRYAVAPRRGRLIALATLFWLMVVVDLAIVIAVAAG